MRAPVLMVLMLALSVVGCPRPEVEVQEEIGQAGMFCVSARDCAAGLQCEQHSCCPDASCLSRCDSLMEKDGTTAAAAVRRHPERRAFIRRKCVALCCSGVAGTEIEHRLNVWARDLPVHVGMQ